MIEHHYTEKGQGKALILLHGNGESNEIFSAQLDALSAHYRVIAFDTRGHGQTPRGEQPFTIRQFAVDLCGFMDRLGIEKAHILGFSDGGNIAMVFALLYPERVDRLILNGANYNTKGVKAYFQLPVEIMYRFFRLFARQIPAAKRRSELLGLMVNDPDLTAEDLHRIKAKTLVLAGTADVIKAKHTRAIADAIPDSELCFIKGNHSIVRKNPEAYNQRVLAFLEEKENA